MRDERDQDVEHLIGRYRPAGPPPDLRARVLALPAPRVWPWLSAAAALFLLILGVEHADDALMARANVITAPHPEQLAADSLAEILGGGREARAAAELVIARQRWQAEQASIDAARMPIVSDVIR